MLILGIDPGCTVLDCNRPHKAKGFCNKHYARLLRGHDPNIKSAYEKTETDRFWEKVDKTDHCWNWTAGTHHGYGSFRTKLFSNRVVGSHRVSYYYASGVKSDSDNHIDHLCRNRKCVNPSHLELVAPEVNVARGNGPTAVNKRKTHCVHGHEFTLENTTYDGDNRHCKTCHRCVAAEWARKRREGVGVNADFRN